ncbi:hypothetical protein SAMN04487884_10510 [Butyrivibrio fibrisolvens]|uniref:Uncharacterized protein n=1 Tax=Butyrivibrio fibrisolvens TaxID=831 RepID=A0A1H9NU26_BUTFI|nr:hypothetical protein [Butyrivibrio fibrisolvens]SER39109.1 hypothetical protein SAMN04487884_10510 [Butyrivibrio fibrisolvens]
MKAPKDQWVIQIDVTNACVRKCANCTRFCGFHKKPYFMDYDYFCKAVDSLEGHPGLIGVMGGEPTLHPRFKDMCLYLQKKIPKQYKVKDKSLYYPTDSFVEVRRRSELKQYVIHEYSDGPRPIIQGAGLWTSMTRLYRDNLEIIQDTFNFQNLNDHNNISYHQPVLISRKDMGIDDETWLKLREKCWVNQQWSGSITPKGCFFCEVAGALDMLYDGPGGLPLENGWWKKDINEFKDQFNWCEYCGIPLKTFARDAREQVTDVSESNYKLLKEKDSVRFDENSFNILEIDNGVISEKSKVSTAKYHGVSYMEDAQDRISDKTPIYANRFIGVMICNDNTAIDEINVQNYLKFMERLFVVKDGLLVKSFTQFDTEDKIEKRKIMYSDLKEVFGKNEYIIMFTPDISFNSKVNKLKECVINPGILHYIDLRRDGHNSYVSSELDNSGKCILFNSGAESLNNMDNSKILNENIFMYICKTWIPEKRLLFSDKMDRMMYGVNESNNKKRTFRRRITDVLIFTRKSIKQYGLLRMVYYSCFFIRRYGLTLTRQKIKNRLL